MTTIFRPNPTWEHAPRNWRVFPVDVDPDGRVMHMGRPTPGGPYTQHEAEEIAESLNEDAEREALTADPDPDRCEACGALALCDCAVYLVDQS